jgi:hypothetical protein
VYNTTSHLPISLSFAGITEGTKANLTILHEHTGGKQGASVDALVNHRSTLAAGPNGTFDFSLPGFSIAVLETL